MYWIIFVMGALVAVVAALVVGGLATPRAHVASRSMTLEATADEIWRTIRSVDEYAEWRPELVESVASTGDDGPEWRESKRSSTMRFGVTVDEPPHRFGARILDEDLAMSGEWLWTLEPVGQRTRVTLTERGEVGNPVARFVRAHMTGHTKAIDAVMSALAARVGDRDAKLEAGRFTSPREIG